MQLDDTFFQSVGLGSASEEAKAQFALRLSELVQSRFADRVTQSLSDEQLTEFERRSGISENEVFAYLDEVLPAYPEMLEEEIAAVKQEVTTDVAAIMQQVDTQ
jgi:uncharacterized protein YidB (DUF937 family)